MQTNFRNTVQHTKGHCNTNKPKGCCTANIQKKIVMQTNQKGYCAANIPTKVVMQTNLKVTVKQISMRIYDSKQTLTLYS